MNFKERFKQFKTWQQEPYHYENSGKGSIRCANCDTEFNGNYCPVCGQKANVERLTWSSVRENISMLWGLESRSMLYTLLQLIVRPGYLIGDYLDGKRKQSYPPVKLLVIVGIFIIFLNYIYELYKPSFTIEHRFFVDSIIYWCEAHPAWGGLALCMVVEFPTWLLFRFSPQHYKHTLPEGFFIQVFIASIIVILTSLTVISDYFSIFMPIYYIVAYKQLFGYKWWGTIWRTLVCIADTFAIVGLFYLIECFIRYFIDRTGINIISVLELFIPCILATIVGFLISKRTSKQRMTHTTCSS